MQAKPRMIVGWRQLPVPAKPRNRPVPLAKAARTPSSEQVSDLHEEPIGEPQG